MGLGVRHGLTDWGLHTITPLPPGGALILASDGVADDLQPKRWADFVTWLVSDVACDPAPVRRLQRELRAWPVPHHRDDKTVGGIMEHTGSVGTFTDENGVLYRVDQ